MECPQLDWLDYLEHMSVIFVQNGGGAQTYLIYIPVWHEIVNTTVAESR